MFLNQLLDEYKESENKQEILNGFLLRLWKSKYTFKKYKKYFKFDVYDDLLDNRKDLIELFNKYNNIEYKVCKSRINKKIDSIDYIRLHINNMYGLLFDKDVYYKNEYYKLLQIPKKEYFRLVNIKKNFGNISNIDYEEVKNNIGNALKEANNIKFKSINRKNILKFIEYKKLINTYIEKIFNNYISAEEYEKKNGWKLNISVDGWSEDNYIIKYFNKSLSGYMRNYIKELNGIVRRKKYIPCKKCGILIHPTGNRQKYCKGCREEINREQIKLRVQKFRSSNGLENL